MDVWRSKLALSMVVAAVMAILSPGALTAAPASPIVPGGVAVDADSDRAAEALAPWTGDLDGVAERGFLRIATAHSPFLIHFDGEVVAGALVELAREFEAMLAERLGRRVDVILMPLPRDAVLEAVIAGRADIAAANLTITPARAEIVAFSDALYGNVRELVVTGPTARPVSTLDALADVGLHLRPSSSYREHLDALNATRAAQGARPIPVTDIDERLSDHDLFEMVAAGIIPAIIVDSHKAALLSRIHPDVTVHEDLAIHEGGEIAWATRPDAPKLLAAINAFVATVKKGTLTGNVLATRYFEEGEWIETIHSPQAQARAAEVAALIADYAGRYGFDPLKILSQSYQESRFDQQKRSHAGAVGVMQVLPSTAADKNVGIENIETLENNVHAGVKYLAFLRDRYFSDAALTPLDQTLFSFAAYNAGPANIRKAREKAAAMGLNPDVWFENVEVAAARTISREPYVYVRNVYKYFVSFALSANASAPGK